MAKLIYGSNMSDGWTEDERGAFDWAPPDDDVFMFITDLMRSAGTYLYGRRMYETLAVWETDTTLANHSNLTADYANAWQAADKVVYSSALAAPLTANTRLERHFSPSAVRDLKAAADRDVLIGGQNLAAQALAAGLVDELVLFVWPVVLGGRTAALVTDTRVDLTLVDSTVSPAAWFISATASGWRARASRSGIVVAQGSSSRGAGARAEPSGDTTSDPVEHERDHDRSDGQQCDNDDRELRPRYRDRHHDEHEPVLAQADHHVRHRLGRGVHDETGRRLGAVTAQRE
jgi:dihydrofolate reductase